MASGDEGQLREPVPRTKYWRLFEYLNGIAGREQRLSFSEIERIIGFSLPASARRHRQWWANQRAGRPHGQALAWDAAGWETADVDIIGQTLLLKRREPPPVIDFDEWWPVHESGPWPEGLTLSRSQLYANGL